MFMDPHLICCCGAGHCMGTGYWVLVLGTGTGAGYWVLGTGILGNGYWVLGIGVLGLGTGLTTKACRAQDISARPVQKNKCDRYIWSL
jgi:hypothetical protein